MASCGLLAQLLLIMLKLHIDQIYEQKCFMKMITNIKRAHSNYTDNQVSMINLR